jgi:hypothetical protein
MCEWTVSCRDDRGRLVFVPLRAAVKAARDTGEKTGMAQKYIDVRRFQNRISG